FAGPCTFEPEVLKHLIFSINFIPSFRKPVDKNCTRNIQGRAWSSETQPSYRARGFNSDFRVRHDDLSLPAVTSRDQAALHRPAANTNPGVLRSSPAPVLVLLKR